LWVGEVGKVGAPRVSRAETRLFGGGAVGSESIALADPPKTITFAGGAVGVHAREITKLM
jgi:hypothetical protein